MRNPRLQTSERSLLKHMRECNLLSLNNLVGFGGGDGDAGVRYWRLFINNSTTILAPEIVELEMRSVPGGANICTGGTGSASSAITNYEAWRAFDGSLASGWGASVKDNQWLKYSFATPVIVREFRFRVSSGLPNGGFPNLVTLQKSADDTNWTDVQQFSTGTTLDTWYTHTITV